MSTNVQPPQQQQSSKLKFKIGIVWVFVVGALTGYGAAIYFPVYQQSDRLSTSHIQVRFSPRGGCLEFTQQAIAQAQKYIFVQAYAFTSAKIATSLIEAHERGVKVKILVDRSQLTAKGSQVKKVYDHGIPVAIDIVPGLAHNKVMIIDDIYVLTGSFNWSNAAEYRNAENLLLINNKDINKIYKENWEKRILAAMPIHLDNLASF